MKKLLTFIPMVFNLQLFAEGPVNTTQTDSLSDEMKTFYSDLIIDNAEPELVHCQFGQKRPIPKGKGKTVEFRKYSPYAKATTPLTEGVTPNGKTLDVSTVIATVKQYGDFTVISDILSLTAIDNNIAEATKLHGSQAGRTLDTIVRDELNAGSNVQYADGSVSDRTSLVGGQEIGNHYLTVNCIKRAVRKLKSQNAPKINGYYVGIIHPDVSFDLTNDPAWVDMHKYATPENMYEGEIGRIAGVRFVETTEAKIFAAVSAEEATDDNKQTDWERDIYSTLIIGDNAYGVTEIAGGGLVHIVKQLGSSGTADPLNQRATVGWKATCAVARLLESNMVRIETASTFESGAN